MGVGRGGEGWRGGEKGEGRRWASCTHLCQSKPRPSLFNNPLWKTNRLGIQMGRIKQARTTAACHPAPRCSETDRSVGARRRPQRTQRAGQGRQDKDTSVEDKDTSVQDQDTRTRTPACRTRTPACRTPACRTRTPACRQGHQRADKDTSVQDKDTSVQTRTPEGCLDLGAWSCDRLSHRRRLIFSARAKQRLLAYHRPLPPQFEMRPLAVFVAAACTFAPTT